jgi:hypothetical protein
MAQARGAHANEHLTRAGRIQIDFRDLQGL